jgi:hypothetical protein
MDATLDVFGGKGLTKAGRAVYKGGGARLVVNNMTSEGAGAVEWPDDVRYFVLLGVWPNTSASTNFQGTPSPPLFTSIQLWRRWRHSS